RGEHASRRHDRLRRAAVVAHLHPALRRRRGSRARVPARRPLRRGGEPVIEFDIDDLRTDPAEREAALTWLRKNDPVHRDPKSGFWLATRHADVREIAKHPEIYSSAPKGPWHLFEARFSMQAMDGPVHRAQRALVSRGFTPRMVERLAGSARTVIDAAIDAVAPRGRCELVSELASPVPI